MLYPSLAILAGLVLLMWSADKFVEGAANTARHFGMPPLLIGMLILGFGTSAPEIVISTLSSLEGKSNLALGNAVGSNISNIALILGFTSLLMPITLHSKALKRELPLLAGVSVAMAYMLFDAHLSRLEGLLLLLLFAGFVVWTVWEGMMGPKDELAKEMEAELKEHQMPLGKGIFWLLAGFAVLLVSSRMLVWGAVEVALYFEVSELVIGLTIVAIGTSLPELASTLAAARKGEDDIALGNILGSNLFNTLAVAGLAGAIKPMTVGSEIFSRDMSVMTGLTFALFLFGIRIKRPKGEHGKIGRVGGALLLAVYIGYTVYLVQSVKS